MIIFDMDGTLVNSGTMIANTINFVRKNIGLEELKKECLLENLNNPHINSAQFFYGTTYFTDKQTKLFEEYYNENCIKDIELYEGIKELLEEIGQKYRLAIATNASDIFAHKILSHLDISHHFDEVVGANQVRNPKPKPDMLLKIIDKYQIDKDKTVLIGDSHKDFFAAKSAGIGSILVNWGFSNHKNSAVNTTEDLRDILLMYPQEITNL